MLNITPKNTAHPKLFSYILGAIAPRPIAFVSTIDSKGNPNLSPFSFFNAFSTNPPICVFSPSRRGKDNTTKHTYENVKEVKEAVINVVNYNIVQQQSLASAEYPKGVNEFIKSGLTPVASELVKPFRVSESPVQMECKVLEIIELGNQAGAGNLVVCEILLMHISEAILNETGGIDPHKIDLVARMGENWYCRASGAAVFEVEKPYSTPGIGIDRMPGWIRNSKMLTGNDLGQLGSIEMLPSKNDIENYKREHLTEIFTKFAANQNELETHLHNKAKQLLEKKKVMEAWKTLLSMNK